MTDIAPGPDRMDPYQIGYDFVTAWLRFFDTMGSLLQQRLEHGRYSDRGEFKQHISEAVAQAMDAATDEKWLKEAIKRYIKRGKHRSAEVVWLAAEMNMLSEYARNSGNQLATLPPNSATEPDSATEQAKSDADGVLEDMDTVKGSVEGFVVKVVRVTGGKIERFIRRISGGPKKEWINEERAKSATKYLNEAIKIVARS